jgi:hypothetical protein
MNFVLDNATHAEMLSNEQNKGVIYGFLKGDDILSSTELQAQRWIINLFDWPDASKFHCNLSLFIEILM